MKKMDLKSQGIWSMAFGCYLLSFWLRRPVIGFFANFGVALSGVLILYGIWVFSMNMNKKFEFNKFGGWVALICSIVVLILWILDITMESAQPFCLAGILRLISVALFAYIGLMQLITK